MLQKCLQHAGLAAQLSQGSLGAERAADRSESHPQACTPQMGHHCTGWIESTIIGSHGVPGWCAGSQASCSVAIGRMHVLGTAAMSRAACAARCSKGLRMAAGQAGGGPRHPRQRLQASLGWTPGRPQTCPGGRPAESPETSTAARRAAPRRRPLLGASQSCVNKAPAAAHLLCPGSVRAGI